MKIAHICTEYHPVPPVEGGAVETWIEHAARGLNGHEVFVFSVSAPSLPRYHKKNHVHYFHFKLGPISRILLSTYKLPFKWDDSPWFYFPYSFWCALRMRSIKPDVIHIHNRPQFVWVCKRLNPRAKIVLHIHQISATAERNLWTKPFADSVDLFLGCSRFVASHLKAMLPDAAHKVSHVYNGVDINQFQPFWLHPQKRAAMRKSLNLGDEKTFLYVGRLVENKGIEVLLKAFRQVLKAGISKVKLVVCGGSGYSKDNVTPFVQRLHDLAAPVKSSVFFTGYVAHKDIHDYYLAADWTVIPSLVEEGFGVISIESLACGVPVLTFASGALTEIVRDNENGFVAAEPTVEKLSEKLTQAARDASSESLGRSGRRMVEQKFTWERIVVDINRHYKMVMDTP